MKRIDQLNGHKGSIYALLSDADGVHFYSAGGDGWIARWPIVGGIDGHLVAEIDDQIFCICQISSGKLVAGTMSGNLYLIDPSDATGTRNISYHKKGVFDVCLLHGQLVCAGGDGRLSVWNPDTMEITETIVLSHQSLRCLQLSPNGQMLAVGSSDHNIYLLHVPSFRIIEELQEAHKNSVFCLQFSPDGKFLVSGGRDAHLNLWDLSNLHLDVSIPAHWYTINAVTYQPGSERLATASRDKTVRIWSSPDLEAVSTLDREKSGGHSASVNHIIWSSDGQILLSAGDDNTIIRWSVQ